jgi:hypothetical protein
MRSTLNCKIEWTVTVEKSEKCGYKLQKQVKLPKDVDMEMAISKFKNGKEIGHGQILVEMINPLAPEFFFSNISTACI